MSFFYLIYLLPLLLLIVIGLIVFFIIRLFGKKRKIGEKGWYLQLFLSKEDLVSQLFFLFSVLFFGLTLLAINKDLGEPFSWRTILLLASLIGLIIAYYFRVIYTLAVSLIGLVAWWSAQAAEWSFLQGKEIKGIAIFLGVLLIFLLYYLIGQVHGKEIKFKRISLVYLLLGLIPITGALFFFSTKSGLAALGGITKGVSPFASWEITISIFLFLIIIGWLLVYGLTKKYLFLLEALAIIILVTLFGALALLPEQTMFLREKGYYGFYRGTELSGTGIFWAILFNILIFLELVGIIFLGYGKRENWLINLGVFFLFLLIFIKYFDWFFAFLDKSVFFIGAGILLLVLGWFMEKGRRYILSAIKKEEIR